MGIRTPYYNITLEGEDITPWVNSVTVVEDDRQADNFTLTIPDPRMIYADALFEGCSVEIDMGYAESNQHALMLRAILTKVELSYPENGVPSITLKGEDKSILMGLVEKKKRWKDLKVTEIVQKIGKSYGFEAVKTQLTSDPIKPFHQDGKTDLAFLQELAEKYHAKCFVELNEQDNEVLYFIPERQIVKLNRPDTLVLRYRMGPTSNLISFSPSFDSGYIDRLKQIADIDGQGKTVKSQEKTPPEVVIWSLDKTRLAQANDRDRTLINALYAKGPTRKQTLQEQLIASRITVGEVVIDKADLESTNDSLEARHLGMSASGSTFGNIWLRAKSNIVIEGVSERFNGNWYVANVTNKIDSSGYKTDFKCVR
ncbi:MAG: phage late control D family protein [Leptolyngbyaceae cyanobacterium]